MTDWIKRYSYWTLASGVLFVSVFAVGIYAWHFRQLSISKDTGNWADFATYLSGTVGVAAVVATLIAFVITLRQQQKLIESQDKQLNIATHQLALAQSKEAVERAYSNSLNILPLMVDSLIERSNREFPEFSSNEFVEILNCVSLFRRISYIEAVQSPNILRMALENNTISSIDIDFFVNDFFSEVKDICFLAFKQIPYSPDVYYIFDNYFKKKIEGNVDVRFFVRCYCAYKQGIEDSAFVDNASEFLNIESRNAGKEFEWLGLGKQVKESIGEVAW